MKNTIKPFQFANSKELTDINIPENTLYIGEYAFKNCKNLKKVVLPQGLEKIDRGAFYGCKLLEEITFPISLETVEAEAFKDCENLKNINCTGNQFKSITSSAFFNTKFYNDSANWQGGLLYLSGWVIDCDKSFDEYMIKSNTIGIAADAFSKKKSVKQVRNPEYEEMIKIFNMSLECSNMPISDISDIPEYISVNTCVKIRFQGFFSDFKKILKPCGNNKTTIDIQTYDLICDLII